MHAAPIDIIRSHTKCCASPLLDRVVLHDTNGSLLFDFVHALTREAEWPVWMDVPIRAIVVLHHLNFTSEGATWRRALHGLTGEGWSSAVFDYFTNDIRDQSFPAAGSTRALRLTCYGGAVTSSNGVHRLTGAIAWLCATQSESASLLKVRTTYYPARLPLVDEIISIRRNAGTLEVARMPQTLRPGPYTESPPVFLLRARSPQGALQLYEVSAQQDHVVPCPTEPRSWISRLCANDKRKDPYASLQWVTLPSALIDAWEHRGWLSASLRHAERCPSIID